MVEQFQPHLSRESLFNFSKGFSPNRQRSVSANRLLLSNAAYYFFLASSNFSVLFGFEKRTRSVFLALSALHQMSS